MFTVRPSPTAGRVQFDRTGPTPPGPFNLDIGTAERLVLNAGDGNDRITGARGLAGRIASTFNGDDGNDRITGTDGEDLLDGGAGNDVIRAADTRAIGCCAAPAVTWPGSTCATARVRARSCSAVPCGSASSAGSST